MSGGELVLRQIRGYIDTESMNVVAGPFFSERSASNFIEDISAGTFNGN